HAERVAKSPTQVSSRSVKTYIRASKGSASGDPDAGHKMCLKYASDEEDDSDCDTLVPFYAIVNWELLPTGLGTIHVIYRKDNSH
ncbi:hypothetical protein Tco_0592166, partial [Tanacetum coccineum]